MNRTLQETQPNRRRWIPASLMAVLLAVALGGSLVGCGEDETAPATPAPAPPAPAPEPEPEPTPPPEPEPTGVPGGLKVSATGAGFIEVSWNAVEGAIGYQVQVSVDATFDESDPAHATTETTFRATIPALATVYIRVQALVGDGSRSDWSEPVSGQAAAPGPGVPTVANAGFSFVQFSWGAVEGAEGYEVQFSVDPEFDESDEITFTTKTQFTVRAAGYFRVRAVMSTVPDRVMSAWSSAAEGVFASGTLGFGTGAGAGGGGGDDDDALASGLRFVMPGGAPLSGNNGALVPDSGTDAATAMATINEELTVIVNFDGTITTTAVANFQPRLLLSGVRNQPFKGLSASDRTVSQMAVNDNGVVFEINNGAESMYVTCNAAGCVSGQEPLDVEEWLCDGWDPGLQLRRGFIDNDGRPDSAATDIGDPVYDGWEFAWMHSSDREMTVDHTISSVTAEVIVPGTRSETVMPMESLTDSDGDFVNTLWAHKDVGDDGDATGEDDDLIACTKSRYSDAVWPNIRDGCFRIGSGSDNLPSYQLTLTPTLDWGAATEYEGTTCQVQVANVEDEFDAADVCDRFEAEVANIHTGRPSDMVWAWIFDEYDADAPDRKTTTNRKVAGFDLNFGRNGIRRTGSFSNVWYHDGSLRTKADPGPERRNIYADYNGNMGTVDDVTGRVTKKMVSDSNDDRPLASVWIPVIGSDEVPLYGDFGKSNFDGSSNDAFNYQDWPHLGGQGRPAPNPPVTCDEGARCDDAGQEFTTKVVWTDNSGATFGTGANHRTLGRVETQACEVEMSYAITCDWDADGGVTTGDSRELSKDNIRQFIPRCSVTFEQEYAGAAR